jgi:hypothetical protein
MEGSQQREVVLEIEHVKIIRKRAKTKLHFCRECNRTTDFISVASAAELFATTTADLFEFSQSHVCHFRVENDQNVLLCLTDLLAAMSKTMKKGSVKLLGEPHL